LETLLARIRSRFKLDPAAAIALLDATESPILDVASLQHGQQLFMAHTKNNEAVRSKSASPLLRFLRDRPGYDRLGEIIHPVTQEEFFAKYWELEALHLPRQDRGYFGSLLSANDLDAAIQHRLHVLREPFKVDKPDNGTGLPNNLTPFYQSPYEAYLDGGAVTLERAERSNLALTQLCDQFQNLFYFARTNVYISPPGMQTFNLHADSGDIFVLQLVGSKLWRLYNRTATKLWPTVHMLRYGELKRDKVGAPLREVALHAGDSLYVPRGMSHEVITGEKEASVHLTISLATGELSWSALLEHTWKGFEKDGHLKSMIESAAHSEMRRALPLGVFRDRYGSGSLAGAKAAWMAVMERVAASAFPLAHHLMQASVAPARFFWR